ncbi:MAG: ABC-type dipeptide/oligopeptide/nickel transport system permease component [Kiritimatiellia bacterium]|jgi:ABC-type dipeptide/oligopeptide/nickel transport system permease component
MVEAYHLEGPVQFGMNWLSRAVVLDFGKSVITLQGMRVNLLLAESIPNTSLVMIIALVPVLLGTFLPALRLLPRRLDGFFQAIGVLPGVIFALFVVAALTIQFGTSLPFVQYFDLGGGVTWEFDPVRLLAGGLVLGIADNALSGAIIGTRAVFDTEVKQRYIGIAILRGEKVLSNALPNVLPTLVGQLRGRVLHLLSGAVIVEVVLQINGLGDLLWDGTLDNDYFIVLAAAWGFSLLSAAMLFFQASSEVAVEMMVRRSPKVPS